MSNFSLCGHYVTKVQVKQKVGNDYGKVEIIITSQYNDDSKPETFAIDGYTLDGKEVIIEQSVDAYGLRSRVKQLESDKE